MRGGYTRTAQTAHTWVFGDTQRQLWPVDIEFTPRPWARRDAIGVIERGLASARLAGVTRAWIRREGERLKVGLTSPGPGPVDRLRDALAPLVADGTIRDLHFRPPTVAAPALDGPLGEALGRYLDHDTAAWLSWERRHPLGDRRSAATLSQAALSDLTFRCLRRRGDRLALWTHLAALGDAPPTRPALVNLAALPRRCAPWLRALTEAYFIANTRLADDLRAHATPLDAFELLERVAVLHWRRFDLDAAAVAGICANLVDALEPDDPADCDDPARADA
ncbi:MAG: hypothetical protein R3A79_14100 [Nannocystaceae bacterium]